jgi:hypothetical protein
LKTKKTLVLGGDGKYRRKYPLVNKRLAKNLSTH